MSGTGTGGAAGRNRHVAARPGIATRASRNTNPLSRACLRCSKGYVRDKSISTRGCDSVDGAPACARCTRLGKKCEPVPPSFVVRGNNIAIMARAHYALPTGLEVGGTQAQRDAHTDSIQDLVEAQRNYTRTVEARVRRSKPPPTVLAATIGVTAVLNRLTDNIEGIHDVLRFQNNLVSLDPEDYSDDDDDGTAPLGPNALASAALAAANAKALQDLQNQESALILQALQAATRLSALGLAARANPLIAAMNAAAPLSAQGDHDRAVQILKTAVDAETAAATAAAAAVSAAAGA